MVNNETPIQLNPVSHLLTQSSAPRFHRRPRKSDIGNSIQGPPCRKLPELEKKKIKQATSTPLIQVPDHHVNIDIQADNPFQYLLKNKEQGHIAFAFYVMHCWETQKQLFDAGDKESFVKQCSKWWTDLPTLYRRSYWSKELEYVSSSVLRRTWINNNSGVSQSAKIKKELDEDYDDQPSSVKRKHSESEDDNCSKMRKVGKCFDDEKLLVEEEDQCDVSSSSTSKLNKREKKSRGASDLQKAFSNYQAMNRDNLSKEMPKASRRDLKKELGRRWKLLDLKSKMTFLNIAKPLPSILDNSEDKENESDSLSENIKQDQEN